MSEQLRRQIRQKPHLLGGATEHGVCNFCVRPVGALQTLLHHGVHDLMGDYVDGLLLLTTGFRHHLGERSALVQGHDHERYGKQQHRIQDQVKHLALYAAYDQISDALHLFPTILLILWIM